MKRTLSFLLAVALLLTLVLPVTAFTEDVTGAATAKDDPFTTATQPDNTNDNNDQKDVTGGTTANDDPAEPKKGSEVPSNLRFPEDAHEPNTVTLLWTDNSTSEDYFSIEGRIGYEGEWVVIGRADANATTYLDPEETYANRYNFDANDTFFYRIRAMYNTDGVVGYSAYSNEIHMFHIAPSYPTNLTAVASYSPQGVPSVKLNWIDNSGAETKYAVLRRDNLDTPWVITEIPADSTDYTDNTVQSGRRYEYEVQAVRKIEGGNFEPYDAGSRRIEPVFVTIASANPADDDTAGTDTTGADTTVVDAAGSIDNFVEVNTYVDGQFQDVSEDEWFCTVVASVFEAGLMQGSSADTFNPMGNIQMSEIITIAARMHSKYYNRSISPVGEYGDRWYDANVQYAIENDIITASDFQDFERDASREQVAYILSNTLPETEFGALNTVNSLPDVNSSNPYFSEIVRLYKAGILAGNDAQGTFYPESNIIRAEVAAIISRLIHPEMRMSGRTFG